MQIFKLWKKPSVSQILLYHRVAVVKNDPYLLCIDQDNFCKQIKWLRENRKIISLSCLVQKIKKGEEINPQYVCLTFDDGYADNYYNALPILQRYKAPATFFITVDKIGDSNPFYWDNSMIKEDQGRALTKTELKKLSLGSLVEIGSHTLSHPHLSALSLNHQEKEIYQSKIFLEKILGKKINGFSYPFGTRRDYNRETINLVKKAGYRYAVANYQEQVNKKSDIYILPRFIIRNWPMEIFTQKMQRLP